MAASTSASAPTRPVQSPWNQPAVRTLQQASSTATGAQSLEEVLLSILDGCSEGLGYLYPSLALLDLVGNLAIGRLICSPRTREKMARATESVGVPLHSFAARHIGRGTPAAHGTARTETPSDAVSYRLDNSENLIARVFLSRSPEITNRLHDLVRPQIPARAAISAQQALGIDSIALMPLVTAERCLGVLIVATAPEQAITDSGLRASLLLAAQAAIVIENAHLHQDLRRREQQVSLLLKATIDAQEEERERICMEIHDGVAQTLAGAFHYLQTLDTRPGLPDDSRASIRKAGALVRTAIREAREVIATLRPSVLDTLGLVSTLRYEMEELQGQMNWRVDFEAAPVRFPKAVETALYRIVHEAVNNVAKHARARQVAVRVKEEQGYIIAEVQDDGVGFDPQSLERQLRRKGVGLLSMRKRAELLQGCFEVISSPGDGTWVRVEVPLLATEDRQDGRPGDLELMALHS